ncbi:MAG TPA: isocitrate lyase/phosphoenolpyruvate mutase family protein [Solirubrobacteraceae bacterium]|nr:isocitrate lyase/phosphoenolpyruvate mutase family protein [Solirubrobacteraceae bacterium]
MELHHCERPLLMPNPWDRGSAKLLASLGFEALATTIGAGFARSARDPVGPARRVHAWCC